MGRAARLRWWWSPRHFWTASAALMLLAAPVALPVAVAARTVAGKPQDGLKMIPLTIEAGGKLHRYKVEVAATADQQAHGMMFRTEMPPMTGMLFPMSPPRAAGFWMENTLISLDLIFVGSDGRVRNIAAEAVPKSRAVLESMGPVAAVLELKGGEAARIGLKPGDKVSWVK
jgi:uncharacterized protein